MRSSPPGKMSPRVEEGRGNDSFAIAGGGTDGDGGTTPGPANVPVVIAPNSAPREPNPDEGTYIYRDFAKTQAPSTGVASVHPQSLQAQKLPAKLASMLADNGKS